MLRELGQQTLCLDRRQVTRSTLCLRQQPNLRHAQMGKHDQYVFTYRGKPIRWVNNTAWKSALKRAGIEDFRWHDLRHAWATFHMQAGTPLHVVQELGGWASPQMVQRYAHLTPGHLASHVASFGEHVKLGVYDPATEKEVPSAA
jgi:integrase